MVATRRYSLHDPYVKSSKRAYESPTRKEHAELTRQAIIKALIDLLIDERPATVSIPAVAKRANVSVRTVYHHFATKEALFDALAEFARVRSGGADLPDATSPREFATRLPDVYRYLDANAALFNAVRVSEIDSAVRTKVDQRSVARTEKALQPLLEQLDEDAFRRLCAVVGTIASHDGYRALTTRYGLSRDEAAAAAGWAITTLTDRAKRTGRVGDGDG